LLLIFLESDFADRITDKTAVKADDVKPDPINRDLKMDVIFRIKSIFLDLMELSLHLYAMIL